LISTAWFWYHESNLTSECLCVKNGGASQVSSAVKNPPAMQEMKEEYETRPRETETE